MGHAGAVKYDGPIDALKQLWKQGGIRSIYRGTGATLLRGSLKKVKVDPAKCFILDVPASGAYLSVYEFLKKKFSGGKSRDTLTPGATLLAGGLAGMANWAVIFKLLT